MSVSGLDLGELRQRLAPLIRDSCLYAGISNPIDGINALRLGFIQADIALEYITGTDSSDWMVLFASCALNYIRQHYMEDLTVHRLTEATGLSKSTLQRDMIAFTGMAPLQYIHHLRMKRAAVLLTGGMPVAEVAFGVGYNTLSSFNRHFQKEYGVAPTQWRKGNTHS